MTIRAIASEIADHIKQTEMIDDYRQRNAILAQLGFSSYKVYLQSDLWKEIRKRVFEARGRLCSLCRESASVIHHKEYTFGNLSGKNLFMMVPLCNRCHEQLEFRDDGSKVSVKRAKRVYKIRRTGKL